jgi:hypothetical protein
MLFCTFCALFVHPALYRRGTMQTRALVVEGRGGGERRGEGRGGQRGGEERRGEARKGAEGRGRERRGGERGGESDSSKSEQVKECMDLKHFLHWVHLDPTYLLYYHTVCTGYTWSPLTYCITTLSALTILGAYSPGDCNGDSSRVKACWLRRTPRRVRVRRQEEVSTARF